MEQHLSTAAVGTRKRRGEGHTRRDEILMAAKELFIREGYQATTIRRIADVVGVSAPALYLYFKDKEAIMLALCDQTFGFLNDQMDELAKQNTEVTDYVRTLEEAKDATDLPEASKDAIARKFERYLRRRRDPGDRGDL